MIFEKAAQTQKKLRIFFLYLDRRRLGGKGWLGLGVFFLELGVDYFRLLWVCMYHALVLLLHTIRKLVVVTTNR